MAGLQFKQKQIAYKINAATQTDEFLFLEYMLKKYSSSKFGPIIFLRRAVQSLAAIEGFFDTKTETWNSDKLQKEAKKFKITRDTLYKD